MEIGIVGTGVSALLVAQAVLRVSSVTRVRLFGPPCRMQPLWLSYWSATPTPFDRFTQASWSTLDVVSAQGRRYEVPLNRFRYRTMCAQPWADATFADVLRSGKVEWVQARVDAVDDELDHATVHAGGQRFHCDWVFSSAPSTPARHHQQFVGWDLHVQGAALDTGNATLLDFRAGVEGDFRFFYALPLGPERLFIEHVSYRGCDHDRALEQYADTLCAGHAWRLTRREAGSTPTFSSPPPREQGRVIGIGVAAGLAKTSTGYALTRMWHDAEQLAATLERYGAPRPRRPILSLYRVADAFFIDLLERQPAQLGVLLSELFAKADGDAVMAFLDERASVREQVQIAQAMPLWLRWAADAISDPDGGADAASLLSRRA